MRSYRNRIRAVEKSLNQCKPDPPEIRCAWLPNRDIVEWTPTDDDRYRYGAVIARLPEEIVPDLDDYPPHGRHLWLPGTVEIDGKRILLGGPAGSFEGI